MIFTLMHFPSSSTTFNTQQHIMATSVNLTTTKVSFNLHENDKRLRLLDWFSVFRRPSRRGDELLQYTALRSCTSQVTLSSQKDGIPTIINMDRRGIDIGSVLCPDCDRDVETTNHLFFSCEMAVDLWVLVARWWELDILITSFVLEWVTWIDTARLPRKVRNCLDAIALTLM
nr:reverse transcriptase domain, reverse transcriptase zinc-binding domain protein [Tanacetum cinerariifolium]